MLCVSGVQSVKMQESGRDSRRDSCVGYQGGHRHEDAFLSFLWSGLGRQRNLRSGRSREPGEQRAEEDVEYL